MKKVFLDSNVILDAILERPGALDARQLLQFGVEGQVKICTSVLSFANIAYILRKYLQGEKTLEVLSALFDSISILFMGDQQVYRALKLEGPDFEDCLQMACATASGCDIIITNNRRHFKGSPLPVYAPKEFIEAATSPER